MFSEGMLVMYGSEGVCRIVRIGEMPFPDAVPGQNYYTLQPMFSSGVIYAPTDIRVVMRPLISRMEAEDLIDGIRNMQEPESVPRDPKTARILYRNYLSRYDPQSFLSLIRMIHQKNEKSGRPYSQTDEQFFRRAQYLLHGELSAVLGIPPEDMEGFIRARVES